MADAKTFDARRVRANQRTRAAREDGSSTPLPVRISTSPQGRVRLLDVVAAGESAFIIAAASGAASVRARILTTESVEIEYGALLVDWGRGTVSSPTGRVTLLPTELRLLGALLEREGEAVASEHLLKCAFAGADGETWRLTVLRTYVHSLRRRLSAIGAASRLQVMPRVGYLLTT